MIEINHAPVGPSGDVLFQKPWFTIENRRASMKTVIRLSRDSNSARPLPEGRTYFAMDMTHEGRTTGSYTYTSLTPEEVEELIAALQLIQEGNRQEKDLI